MFILNVSEFNEALGLRIEGFRFFSHLITQKANSDISIGISLKEIEFISSWRKIRIHIHILKSFSHYKIADFLKHNMDQSNLTGEQTVMGSNSFLIESKARTELLKLAFKSGKAFISKNHFITFNYHLVIM